MRVGSGERRSRKQEEEEARGGCGKRRMRQEEDEGKPTEVVADEVLGASVDEHREARLQQERHLRRIVPAPGHNQHVMEQRGRLSCARNTSGADDV